MSSFPESYKGPIKLVRQYWGTYGGWSGFFSSPYLHFSLLLLLVTYGTWSEDSWWDNVFTVVPSLLGFSLGALAIFLGFGSERFRDVISGKRPDKLDEISPYMSVTAAFTHFIVVQIWAVVIAVVSGALFLLPAPEPGSTLFIANKIARAILWGIGYWLFLYALCLAAASVFGVFRIASWYDAHRTKERKEQAVKGTTNQQEEN